MATKRTYLLNAFSLNMLSIDGHSAGYLRVYPMSVDEVRFLLKGENGYTSAVGHAETAAVFSGQLGMPVLFNRATVSLNPGDAAIVGQYKGPRLPEGATTLPEGAKIDWMMVEFSPYASL